MPAPSAEYVGMVRRVLSHTHKMTLNEPAERDFLTRCEGAELFPHHVASVIAMHTKKGV
jgi:hypothetical protein